MESMYLVLVNYTYFLSVIIIMQIEILILIGTYIRFSINFRNLLFIILFITIGIRYLCTYFLQPVNFIFLMTPLLEGVEAIGRYSVWCLLQIHYIRYKIMLLIISQLSLLKITMLSFSLAIS